MISLLHIKNIGIIDDLTIELDSGLNVFTGETGAGKTLIIDAINIISGGRFSKEMIRKGEDFSFVELNLFLPNNENAIDNNIIVSREIYSNGKNNCKINGRLVTVSELKDFMNSIIDIHGQNDNQKILYYKNHIKYLDNFAGKDLKDLLLKYKNLYQKYIELNKQLKENFGDNKERQRQLDLLQYEFEEIDKANLNINEEDNLNQKHYMFENFEKVSTNLNIASESCNKAIDNINDSIKAFDKISNIDDNYNAKLSEFKNIYYEIEELSRDLSDMYDNVFFDENERNNVEERLDLIYSLKRKYGNSIEEILKYKSNIENEIDKLNNIDEINDKINADILNVKKEMIELADKIHLIREKNAKVLLNKINNELCELEMSNAKFDVNITTEDFNSRGIDIVHFYITTNLGEDKKELDKIASGGEMSRIMLAIKTILADSDDTPVMIFDEIDSGISGKAAKVVGNKLKIIGKTHQVICITHQPSIAAKGDNNFFIKKIIEENRTHTVVNKLNENEVIDEIARIANGDVTEIARQHAIELRKSA